VLGGAGSAELRGSVPRRDEAVHPLLADGEVVAIAGVYDVLSAKLAERAGLPAVRGPNTHPPRILKGFGRRDGG